MGVWVLETIVAVITGCAFTLGVVKFIVSRFDKKIESREEFIAQREKVLNSMANEIRQLHDDVRDHENKISNLEKGSAKFERSMDGQMKSLDEKLEKIYAFLLQGKINS